MEENILTIKETANYLRMSDSTIYKLILEGNLPATKVANKWRIRKSKLERWIDEKEYGNNQFETSTLAL
ncbi:helix-turn-helix domain-containing protein [candidate division KSB1 bacterium]